MVLNLGTLYNRKLKGIHFADHCIRLHYVMFGINKKKLELWHFCRFYLCDLINKYSSVYGKSILDSHIFNIFHTCIFFMLNINAVLLLWLLNPSAPDPSVYTDFLCRLNCSLSWVVIYKSHLDTMFLFCWLQSLVPQHSMIYLPGIICIPLIRFMFVYVNISFSNQHLISSVSLAKW